MFQKIHLLHKDVEKEEKYVNRWIDISGHRYQEYINKLVENGAGEDFLQSEYQAGRFPILENEWDLKGINLSVTADGAKCSAGKGLLEAIDFSYASIISSKINDFSFESSGGSFVRVYNSEFSKCLFFMSGWYGSVYENVKFIKCDFFHHGGFQNCKFINCEFVDCFMDTTKFDDCLFNVNTKINGVITKAYHNPERILHKEDISDIYKGIKDAYWAGMVFDKYREYLFKQKVAERKYMKKGFSMMVDVLKEGVVGYGIWPANVILTSLLVIVVFSYIYQLFNYSFYDSVIMSLGAFTTMGEIPRTPVNIFFLLEAGFGISLFALFITVLANVWFSEK